MLIEIILFVVMLFTLAITLIIMNIRFPSKFPKDRGQKIIFNVLLFAFGIAAINILLSVFVDSFLLK